MFDVDLVNNNDISVCTPSDVEFNINKSKSMSQISISMNDEQETLSSGDIHNATNLTHFTNCTRESISDPDVLS